MNEYYPKNNFEELLDIFNEKKPVALFLGAGINSCFPKMRWSDLTNNLLKNAISILAHEEGLTKKEKEIVSDYLVDGNKKLSVYLQATLIKKVLGENYLSYLQNHLYSNCNTETIHSRMGDDDNYLIEVARLILSKRNIKAAITYNYDNYLAEAISLLQKMKGNFNSKIKLNAKDIFRSKQDFAQDETTFPIYHVHGFIPPPDRVLMEDAENVVLSLDEYFSNMIEPFSWQTTTQLFYLNNFNCLFLGISLDDWNMLRALAYSKRYSKAVKHFILFRNESYKKGPKIFTFLNRVKASIYEEVGINLIFTETDSYKELYQKIKQLSL